MQRKKIVVFTGAGVSADSGIATFRDADGLWANYRVEDVCTPEALRNNRSTVIEFYNMRRRESLTKKPNAGHIAIAQMEQWADVQVITQNVDNLHEQAGSTRVLHLHGELMKLRSESNPNLIYNIDGWEQSLNARAEDGSLLRPYIVFFGESVPMFEPYCGGYIIGGISRGIVGALCARPSCADIPCRPRYARYGTYTQSA